jgi:uncharacterized protein (TIGR03435 family)
MNWFSCALRPAGRPVIDRTGLPGGYDFDLTMGTGRRSPRCCSPIDGPSFVVALEEQLGLRLENTRTAMEFVVVESVQRPAEN